MRHFHSKTTGIAYCGANVGQACCFSRHAVVDCPKCLYSIYLLTVQCCRQEECDWKGPLWQAWVYPGNKKRFCPRCAGKSTKERLFYHPVIDEFGMQVAMPEPTFVIREAIEYAADQ